MYSVAGYDIYLGEVLLGIAALGILSFLSIIGAQKAGFVDTIMAMALATSFLIIVISALFSPITSWEHLKPFWGTAADPDLKEVARGIIAVIAVTPWAYVGFGTIPQEVEEFNFSTKKVIGIMVVAVLFGCAVYSCNTLVTASVSPDWTAFINQHDWAVGAAVEALMGKPGLVVLGVAISCAILTGMLGFLTATSRLLFFMAGEGTIPAWFGKLHHRYKTPANAIIFCFLFSAVGPWFGRTALGWFVDMSAIGAAVGYGYTNLCAFLTMKKDHEIRTHIGFAFTSVLGGIFSVFFLMMLLVPGMPGCLTAPSYIMLVIWLLMGALFYWFRSRKK